MKTTKTLGWHFLQNGGFLRWDTVKPKDNIPLVIHDPQNIQLCQYGLHACKDLIYTFMYAPGTILCRVECEGIVDKDNTKFVCKKRTILWRRVITPKMRNDILKILLDYLNNYSSYNEEIKDEILEHIKNLDKAKSDLNKAIGLINKKKAEEANQLLGSIDITNPSDELTYGITYTYNEQKCTRDIVYREDLSDLSHIVSACRDELPKDKYKELMKAIENYGLGLAPNKTQKKVVKVTKKTASKKKVKKTVSNKKTSKKTKSTKKNKS